jgi:1-acyl-sn-glycerol-3-phosphate acyltransferase
MHSFAKNGCSILLWAMGQKTVLSGTWPEQDTPRIYVFNHSSLLDTLVCIAHIDEYTASIGKKEQFSIPIWGRILRHWGCIPIDRQNREKAIQQLEELRTVFSGDKGLLVSPEGTRSRTGELLPFKKGPFHIAEQCKAHIIPIALCGAFASKNKNSWRIQRGIIYAYIEESIPPSSMEIMREQTYQALKSKIDSHQDCRSKDN